MPLEVSSITWWFVVCNENKSLPTFIFLTSLSLSQLSYLLPSSATVKPSPKLEATTSKIVTKQLARLWAGELQVGVLWEWRVSVQPAASQLLEQWCGTLQRALNNNLIQNCGVGMVKKCCPTQNLGIFLAPWLFSLPMKPQLCSPHSPRPCHSTFSLTPGTWLGASRSKF